MSTQYEHNHFSRARACVVLELLRMVPRAAAFVAHDGPDVERMLGTLGTWSRGEQIMIKVALDLHDPGCVEESGREPATINDLILSIDDANFATVFAGIVLLRKVLGRNP